VKIKNIGLRVYFITFSKGRNVDIYYLIYYITYTPPWGVGLKGA